MPLPKRLTGPQLIQLRDIILKMFTLPEFDDFLRAGFNVDYTDFAIGARSQVYRDVIVYFNNRSNIPSLLSRLRMVRQDDDELPVFIQEISGLASLPPGPPENSELERTIKAANSLLNPRAWIKRLAAIEGQVCRVEVPIDGDFAFGTGFLVAPDVVITNYHVVEHVISKQVKPAAVGLRFDYALLEDGVTPSPGTLYRLADDWLIDHSEYSALDTQENPADDPPLDQLDYALLRVAGTPGNAPVGGAANKMPSPQTRGWIEVPSRAHQFAPKSALYIMQHPEGKELKLALDTDAVIGVNRNGTRVRYKTNTESGSSGSPCFDANWNLVALHHGGDPNYDKLHHPQFNQGIPIAAIVRLLEQRGKIEVINNQNV